MSSILLKVVFFGEFYKVLVGNIYKASTQSIVRFG